MKRWLFGVLICLLTMTGQASADVANGRLFWTTHAGIKTAKYHIDASGNLTLGPVSTVINEDIDMAVFEQGGRDLIAGAHDRIIRVPTTGGPATDISSPGSNALADHILIDYDRDFVYSSRTGGPSSIPPAQMEATDITTGTVTTYNMVDGSSNPVPVSGLTFGDPDDLGPIAPILYITDNDSNLYTVDLSGIGAGTTLIATKILDLGPDGNLAHQVSWSQTNHELYVGGGNVLTQIQVDAAGTLGTQASITLPTGTIFDNARRRGDHVFFTDVSNPNHEIYLIDLNGNSRITDGGVTLTSLNVSDVDDIIPLESPGGPLSGPRVLIRPFNMDFGYHPTFTTGLDTLVILNIGDDPLTISAIDVAGLSPVFHVNTYLTLDENEAHVFQSNFSNLNFPVTVGPDSALALIVSFEPEGSDAEQSFDASIIFVSNDVSEDSLFVAVSGTTIQPQLNNVKVRIGRDFGAPGANLSLPITLDTGDHRVAGLQMDIFLGDGVASHFSGLSDTSIAAAPEFELSANTIDDTLRLVLFSPGGAILSQHSQVFMGYLVYSLDSEEASLGTAISVPIGESVAGDSLGFPLPLVKENGELQVGIHGDLNLDGTISIFDVIKTVRIIVGKDQEPAEGTVFFNIANANNTGDIDVSDLIYEVNLILELPNNLKVTAGSLGPVAVNLGGLQTLADGQFVIPITLDASGPVAGFQAMLTFDPSVVRIGTPYLLTGGTNASIESHIVDGTLRLAAYTLTPAQGIGHGTVALIPVTLLNGASATAGVTLSSVIVVNPAAAQLPVEITVSSVKVAALPTAFGLKNNRPNPFNPSTTISYEVPQQAHIRLTVYNLLGQEVITLVNEVKTAGHYNAVWNGTNARGVGIASGVYLYRITSSTGYTKSKRMTLLK